MSTTAATRRTKWYPTPPPPPSPQILNLPRRTRRKQHKTTAAKKQTSAHHYYYKANLENLHLKYHSYKEKLENLFDQENESPGIREPEPLIVLLNSSVKSESLDNERRERVEREEKVGEEECGEYCGGFEEEKWRFQAEILRAECNFLRMEREFALKKLERNRVKMERTLRSAVQTLVSGRNKIFEGKNVSTVLDEEIEDLAQKLKELQRNSKTKDFYVRSCSNFDKKACLLQRRLEKLGSLSDESCIKELQELAQSSTSFNKESSISPHNSSTKSTDVDRVSRTMEGLSKGMLECGSMLCSTTNSSSIASSASTSNRIDQCPESSTFSTRQLNQESASPEENKCSGRCKAIVHRIVEQVRAETEQWSQMQEMLGQVRGEMEELQASRDYWENRANNSIYEIQSLRCSVMEWRDKALKFETKANKLETEFSELKLKLETLSTKKPHLEQSKEESLSLDLPPVPLVKQLESEKSLPIHHPTKEDDPIDGKRPKEGKSPSKDLPPISLGKQLAKEKSMLLRRMKENRHNGNAKCGHNGGFVPTKRSPLSDVGNSSPLSLVRQNSKKAIFPLQSPESWRTKESFRK